MYLHVLASAWGYFLNYVQNEIFETTQVNSFQTEEWEQNETVQQRLV